MLSTEIALRVLREGWIGDRLESLAYNALPSGYSYDYSGHVYYILQNQVMATNGYHEFDCDHGDSSAFGAPCGFDCCFSNNHMGWPKFVQSMWMAKANGGVAATAYGPCTLTYGDIVFREKTDYPFKDCISIEYDGKEKEFELSLRIPEWCDCPRVSVNGELYSAQKGSFLEIKRVWKRGDVCELCFEMKIRTSDGYNRSRAVSAGALIFSYPVKERWSLLENNSARELKVPALGKTENRNVHPDGDWNYALFESGMELAFSQEVSAHPFTPGSAPCKIKAKAVGMPQWSLDSNIAAVQPYGGARADITKAREIELVPYGCTRLKVTHFPKAEGAGNIYYPVFKSRYNGSYYEFSSVTLPKARDYELVLSGEGEAEVHINGAFFSRVSFKDGKCRLCGLSELNVRDEMAFDSRHYNNIRVYGARVHSLEILPVSEFKELVIKEISVTDSSVKVKVNADRSFCPVTLKCGKRIGEYDITVSGFKSDTAYVNCLESGESYYIELSALINGEIFSTKPMRITTLELPEEERALAKTDVIPCRALPFYNGVSIEYSKVKGAEYYEVWYTTERGKYTSAVSGFRFNPYKGSFCFEKDILSLSLERGREYHLRLKAFNGKCQIAQSRELFIKI